MSHRSSHTAAYSMHKCIADCQRQYQYKLQSKEMHATINTARQSSWTTNTDMAQITCVYYV